MPSPTGPDLEGASSSSHKDADEHVLTEPKYRMLRHPRTQSGKTMQKFLADTDRLLRGGYTRPEDLRAGHISMPTQALVIGGLVMGCIYGVFMGLYGATRPDTSTFLQLLATTLKVPLLFLLTLGITFPSLYVFSSLAGGRLRFEQTLRLLLAAVAINLALLASLGPVVGFFTLSAQSYPFMIVLNVILFAFSGL